MTGRALLAFRFVTQVHQHPALLCGVLGMFVDSAVFAERRFISSERSVAVEQQQLNKCAILKRGVSDEVLSPSVPFTRGAQCPLIHHGVLRGSSFMLSAKFMSPSGERGSWHKLTFW